MRARIRVMRTGTRPSSAGTINHVVWVADQFDPKAPTMTVTNDAEAVVEYLHERFPGYRIVYRDTEGEWAELEHDRGVFTGFAPWKGDVPDG